MRFARRHDDDADGRRAGRHPDRAEPPVGPPPPDSETVHTVLDLALRIGEIQLSSGAGGADVTATVLGVTYALGLPRCEVDVIYTSIVATCLRGSEYPSVTSMRVVRSRGLDYGRLTATEDLVRRILDGRLHTDDAYAELNRILDTPRLYPRWVATSAWGGLAFCVAWLLGGGLAAAVSALVISALIDRVGRVLNRYRVPSFFQQVVGGLVATLAATLITTVDLLPIARPTLVSAAAITVLLSGMSTVATMQDAITGYSVTAAGRAVEIAQLSAGLIAGVVLALQAAPLVGLPPNPPELPLSGPMLLPVAALAGAGAAAFFALAGYARPRALPVAAAAGAIGVAVHTLLILAGFHSISASAVAATLAGFGGGLLARKLKITPLVVAMSGITPLLPGFSTYRGLYELVSGGTLVGLMTAIAIGLVLAAGVVLGQFLAQPVRTGLGRLERRLAGPRMAGPLGPRDTAPE
jgi:uncharacterized membrane protein YjjP (DUF1212 family)